MKKIVGIVMSVVLTVCCFASISSVGAENQYLCVEVGKLQAGFEETVDVPISIKTNPGLTVLGIEIKYDSSAMELIDVNKVNFADEIDYGLESPDYLNNPYVIQWVYALSKKDITYTGDIAVLTFQVKNAEKDGKISVNVLKNDPDNASNFAGNTVVPTDKDGNVDSKELEQYFTEGSLEVHDFGEWTPVDDEYHKRECKNHSGQVQRAQHNFKDGICTDCGQNVSFVPGDVDGNISVNLNDVTRLAQYVAKWKVEVNEPALDPDGNGSVNLNDVTRLAQKVAKWNVTISDVPYELKKN